MVEWHVKGKRKSSGGIRKTARRRDKRVASKGGSFTSTKVNVSLEKNKHKTVLGRGNTEKLKLFETKTANVLDREKRKHESLEIVRVIENNANREYARRNIITKGSLIEVKKDSELLKAKVTSRPGQTGTVNAVLVKEKA